MLSVVTSSLALHTGPMATDRQATFVTGADGFVGTELIKVFVARGHQVFGLTPSAEAAYRLRRAGAVPVMGDLLEPGQWQDEAAADWIFHLPPHAACVSRVTRRRARSIARRLVLMDAHLVDAVADGATKRIVHVADTGCYGATGPHPITEDAPPRSSAWGRCFTPVLDRLDGYVIAGLPIVTAFSGWVYGNGSWLRERVIEPVIAAGTFARLANRPLRVWRVPAATARFVVGPVLADSLQTDAVFSNLRLRGIGFRYRYPTLEQGLQQVLGALNE
ncbi:MAG: hypothetical protein DMF84_28115 [Acidobacteria bacterium]|nr:MAG: hypothetical protein DMF84_28115 [Acidobacteriota bacterium]